MRVPLLFGVEEEGAGVVIRGENDVAGL